jgi:hypothetical protein
MRHHAFVIEAELEKGIATASEWVEKELNMATAGNPDVVVVRFGLLSVADARLISKLASGAPFTGEHKVIIVAANRAYHEAQNALLKLFEEPPPGIYLFLVLPSLGGLLPTLRSRVSTLFKEDDVRTIPEPAEQFLKASKEKRTALIKKLTSGSDDEERRENREEALTIVNGVETAAYSTLRSSTNPDRSLVLLLNEISTLREALYDRSSSLKMILEHLSLVIPRGLPAQV